jgi:SAM-dependent methyltransferase
MAEKHFQEQRRYAQSFLIPYLERRIPGFTRSKILEVGCAEGGVLDILEKSGCRAVGLELSAGRGRLAVRLNPNLNVRTGDITDRGAVRRVGKGFDVVVMRDVIEHVHDKQAAFDNVNRLLKRGGHLYITFPPKHSPFAGHQQNGRSALRMIPYLHRLPRVLLQALGAVFREHPHIIENAALNFRRGLSIREFERLCGRSGFSFVEKGFFLIRPVYRIRHGLRPVRLPDIPVIREFLAFGCECLLKKSAVPFRVDTSKSASSVFHSSE